MSINSSVKIFSSASVNSTFNVTENTSYDLTGIDSFALGVGVGYICSGVIFIFLQLSVAWLIYFDKEMQNPTYMLVVNLSITDSIELVALGLFSGTTIIIDAQWLWLDKCMSFVCLTAWYANCVLFVYIAFSRWIAITKSELVPFIFTKNVMRVLHWSAWVPVAVLSFYGCIICDPSEFVFYRHIFTWGFNLETRMGEIWHWINFGTNTLTATLEMTFNVMSLYYVYKTRKQIISVATSEVRRREIKLLIQCFIIGCVFTVANFMFTLAYGLGWTDRVAFACTQATWTFNHCVNPLVYLGVNTVLRKSFTRFFTCGKCAKKCSTVYPTTQ